MSAIVSAIDTKVLSMQELQEVVGIAVNYCNDCPRWFLKGHSSTEASALLGRGESVKTPPRIVAGPTMKAAGMDITLKCKQWLMVCFMIHSPERKSDGMILALVGVERNIRNVAAGITEKGLFVEMLCWYRRTVL